MSVDGRTAWVKSDKYRVVVLFRFVNQFLSEKFVQHLSVDAAAFGKIGVCSGRCFVPPRHFKYAVRLADDSERYFTLDEAIDAGYIVRKPAEISEPWAEHNITLIPAAEIAAKGYAEVKRTNAGGHRYAIVTASGVTFTHGYEWLIAEGLATRNPVEPVESDKPWPGDGAYASDEFLAERGVKKIQRVKYGAENRYRVEFTDREPLEDVSAGTMRKLRYIV